MYIISFIDRDCSTVEGVGKLNGNLAPIGCSRSARIVTGEWD